MYTCACLILSHLILSYSDIQYSKLKNINIYSLGLCLQILKVTPESQRHKKKDDTNEEAQLKIMEWAKELQKTTEVRVQKNLQLKLQSCYRCS